MSMQQETRFQCNRCFIEISVPINEQPALLRGKPPSGWLVLHVGEATAPPWHLCTICEPLFQAFMREKGGE